MISKNNDVRQYAKDKNVFLWQIAEQLGMLDNNFSRKLRNELSDDDKKKIKSIIDQIAKEKVDS